MPYGFLSSLNSTTTPLGGGGVYTGGWELALDYASLVVSVISNVASANDGLHVQWSNDGSTVTIDNNIYDTNAGVGRSVCLEVRGVYVRVVYTNGAGAQATFNLATIMHDVAMSPRMFRMEDVIDRQGQSFQVKGEVSRLHGVGDAGNSTTTPLGAGAVYTGGYEDVSNYRVVSLSVNASHASAVGGLVVQWSSDGTNLDYSEAYTISAGIGWSRNLEVHANFYRVVYTNGGTLQTSFRLKSIYHPTSVGSGAIGGYVTDLSGTLTSGGVAQSLAAANPARKYLLIQAPSSNTEPIFIRFTGTATQTQVSMRLDPGDAYENAGAFIITQAVSWIAATTGTAQHSVEG